jgi:hypothetical protein
LLDCDFVQMRGVTQNKFKFSVAGALHFRRKVPNRNITALRVGRSPLAAICR